MSEQTEPGRTHPGVVVLGVIATIAAVTVAGTLWLGRTVTRHERATHHFVEEPDAARRLLEAELGEVEVYRMRFEARSAEAHVVVGEEVHRYAIHSSGRVAMGGAAQAAEGTPFALSEELMAQVSRELAAASERSGSSPLTAAVHRAEEGAVVLTIRMRDLPRPLEVPLDGEVD